MITINRIFAILLITAALVILAHTLYGSVFYAADETSNPRLVQETQQAQANIDENRANQSFSVNNPTPASTQISVQTKNPRFPSEIIIPKLDVRADIQYVGVNAKGNMGVPNNFTDVAWYKLGTVPGDTGSAVMAGHVNNGLGLSGVFKHLSNLAPGDDVFVMRQDGTKLHFKVDRTAIYNYKDVPLAIIFEADDMPHLNLITCAGNWIGDQKTYEERIVVYTTLMQ